MVREKLAAVAWVAAGVLVAAILGGAWTPPTVAQPGPLLQPVPTSNPLALQQVGLLRRQLDALNRGDLAGVLATFTDDAVLEGLGMCRSSPCIGAAPIQQEIQREIAQHTRITVAGINATPPRLRGQALLESGEVRAAGVERIQLTFTGEVRGDRIASIRWELDLTDAQTATYASTLSTPASAAELVLTDPRPCIPETGQRVCDATRTALWNGDAAAWAARGVTNPDPRFNETVVFRVRAGSGDPAAITNIARFLGVPYLKVTRVQFADNVLGSAEFAEITNLGGGAQDLTGWTIRSPARGAVFGLPTGVVLDPGESCRLYTGRPLTNPFGVCRTFTSTSRLDSSSDADRSISDVWPDEGGRVVLFYDALALPGDDTTYSADPNNQPPPPNVQIVTTARSRE